MDKSEFLSLLSSNGYPAIEDNGIPIVTITGDERKMKEDINKIKTIAERKGYHSSFGIRCRLTGNAIKKKEKIEMPREMQTFDATEEIIQSEEYTQMSLF